MYTFDSLDILSTIYQLNWLLPTEPKKLRWTDLYAFVQVIFTSSNDIVFSRKTKRKNMVIPAFFRSRNFVSSFQHPWVYTLNVTLILQAHVRKSGFCISNAEISRVAENSKPRKAFENARLQALEFSLKNRKVGAPFLKNLNFPKKVGEVYLFQLAYFWIFS